MNKKILYSVAIAIMMLLAACSSEENLPVNEPEVIPEAKPEIGRTISFTVSMPDDPNTRVSLNQDPDTKNIKVRWEENDEIRLVFFQGKNNRKIVVDNVKIRDIEPDGIKAHFTINIPPTITSGDFYIYGIYGGGDISSIFNDDIEDHVPFVKLPSFPLNSTSLNEGENSIEKRKDVMLFFKHTMNQSDTGAKVTFEHAGSLFCVSVKAFTGITGITSLELKGKGASTSWAVNTDQSNNEDIAFINLYNKDITNVQFRNALSFNTNNRSVGENETIEFWLWNPPSERLWPELELSLGWDKATSESQNLKTARTSPTAKGKSYYFYATWTGDQLWFTSSNYVIKGNDLFFSEYVDGADNNKYLEIYNSTGADVDLSNYTVELYKDGASSNPIIHQLTGSLANKGVLVLKKAGADYSIAATATESVACEFDGNDAIVLRKKSANVDIIGVIGKNPGSGGWTATGGISTSGKALVRRTSIFKGITTNPTVGFTTLGSEWISSDPDPKNNNLGSHTTVNP